TLQLEEHGLAIEGQLAVPFALPAGDPTAPHEYRVRAKRDLPHASVEHTLLECMRLVPEGVEVFAGTSPVAADGPFRIEGLDPGVYALALECANDGRVRIFSHEVPDVSAPASGII